jgi:hypothetical protein
LPSGGRGAAGVRGAQEGIGQPAAEALDPDKLEGLNRYEVHLDRKLERTMAMLLCFKDLRLGLCRKT